MESVNVQANQNWFFYGNALRLKSGSENDLLKIILDFANDDTKAAISAALMNMTVAELTSLSKVLLLIDGIRHGEHILDGNSLTLAVLKKLNDECQHSQQMKKQFINCKKASDLASIKKLTIHSAIKEVMQFMLNMDCLASSTGTRKIDLVLTAAFNGYITLNLEDIAANSPEAYRQFRNLVFSHVVTVDDKDLRLQMIAHSASFFETKSFGREISATDKAKRDVLNTAVEFMNGDVDQAELDRVKSANPSWANATGFSKTKKLVDAARPVNESHIAYTHDETIISRAQKYFVITVDQIANHKTAIYINNATKTSTVVNASDIDNVNANIESRINDLAQKQKYIEAVLNQERAALQAAARSAVSTAPAEPVELSVSEKQITDDHMHPLKAATPTSVAAEVAEIEQEDKPLYDNVYLNAAGNAAVSLLKNAAFYLIGVPSVYFIQFMRDAIVRQQELEAQPVEIASAPTTVSVLKSLVGDERALAAAREPVAEARKVISDDKGKEPLDEVSKDDTQEDKRIFRMSPQ